MSKHQNAQKNLNIYNTVFKHVYSCSICVVLCVLERVPIGQESASEDGEEERQSGKREGSCPCW